MEAGWSTVCGNDSKSIDSAHFHYSEKNKSTMRKNKLNRASDGQIHVSWLSIV